MSTRSVSSNRTNVGLKPALLERATSGQLHVLKSDQCGIETSVRQRRGIEADLCSNRTNVGLKLRASSASHLHA